MQTPQTCPTCHGSGLKGDTLCPTCGGTMTVSRSRRLDVKIPAGVREGSRIRVAGEGSPGPGGGTRGDLYLLVHVNSDPQFEREGDDLHTSIDTPVTKLVLGGETQVPTLNGRVTMRIPAASQNGRKMRLAGQGMPHLRGGGRGDLYVRLNAVLPTSLTDEQRGLFQQLEKAGV